MENMRIWNPEPKIRQWDHGRVMRVGSVANVRTRTYDRPAAV